MADKNIGSIFPNLEEFKELAKSRRVIPVAIQLMADTFTPVGLYQTLTENKPGTFLLESAENGKNWSRYSFIGVSSSAVLREENGKGYWSGKPPKGLINEKPIWEVLTQALQFLKTESFEALPPLTGGLVGYLSYDIVRVFEEIPDENPNETSVPDLFLLLTTDFAVLDHSDGTVWLIANAVNYDGTSERVEEAYSDCVKRIENMRSKLEKVQGLNPLNFNQITELKYSRRTESDEYRSAVRKAIDYIEAGDAFQIVLSQRFEIECNKNGLDIYRILRNSNPSPYMYYINFPNKEFSKTDFEIVGSSPEALISIKDRKALVHPIAGTRPRAKNEIEDEKLATDLLNDEKEKAEHLMLVDLGRNDLGRFCKPGSIEVVQFMQVEKYSHVMHLVSTITGELNESVTVLDALKSTFPAGTLSGAPKVRAMEIIDELEPVKRGIYGGALGYFDFAGNMDLAITIRTALIKDNKAYVQAGAGIVADSIPESEDLECQNKAAVVLKAIAISNTLD
jgi:anthranilate synthase component 1